jgi:hypothetical protein
MAVSCLYCSTFWYGAVCVRLHVFLMSSKEEVVPILEHALVSRACALKCTVLFLEK